MALMPKSTSWIKSSNLKEKKHELEAKEDYLPHSQNYGDTSPHRNQKHLNKSLPKEGWYWSSTENSINRGCVCMCEHMYHAGWKNIYKTKQINIFTSILQMTCKTDTYSLGRPL